MKNFVLCSLFFVLCSLFFGCKKHSDLDHNIANKIIVNNARFNYTPKHWVDAQYCCMAGAPDNCTTTNAINLNDTTVSNTILIFNDVITLGSSAVQDFFYSEDWQIIFPILAQESMSTELSFVRSGNCIVELIINPTTNINYYLFKRVEENKTTIDFVIPMG